MEWFNGEGGDDGVKNCNTHSNNSNVYVCTSDSLSQCIFCNDLGRRWIMRKCDDEEEVRV